jgi:S1-C subfamily serine protease
LGDIIVGLDGKPTETMDDLLDAMEQHNVGDEVTVEYLRGSRRHQVRVVLQAVN